MNLAGAFVPLVGGDWGEEPGSRDGPADGDRDGVQFERTDHTSVTSPAQLTSRPSGMPPGARSIAGVSGWAGVVCAVQDGAKYRPDAARILDFPYAVEYLGAVAWASF